MNNRLVLSAAVTLAASFGASAPALADTVDCMMIDTLPYVIEESGVYCLADDMDVSMAGGAAVEIAAHDVTLDCNDRGIVNAPPNSATYAVGIYARGMSDVTVRNCDVAGFVRGIQLDEGRYTVENNEATRNWAAGIVVSGDGSSATRNRVLDTGGSTIAGVRAFVGIQAVGDVDLSHNVVDGVMATVGTNGTAYGIYSEGNDGGEIFHNTVRDLVSDGTGRRRGIWNALGSHVTVWGNVVVFDGMGLVGGEVGIRCGDIRDGASRVNTVLGVGANASPGLVNCPEATGDFVNPL